MSILILRTTYNKSKMHSFLEISSSFCRAGAEVLITGREMQTALVSRVYRLSKDKNEQTTFRQEIAKGKGPLT